MTLPEPNFIDRDQKKITAEIIAEYEKKTGKVLYPAQVERLLIDIIAYRETIVRIGIQEAAKQNLVAFARAPMLDYLGELVGVTRLAAKPAKTMVSFTLSKPSDCSILIPSGTRVAGGAGNIVFATDEHAILRIGQTSIEIMATCKEVGISGNNWAIGQINQLLDELMPVCEEVVMIEGDETKLHTNQMLDTSNEFECHAVNISVSTGGVEAEDDDRLRARIKLAPESFSNAGSREAYRFHAKTAHQDIIDVAVISPSPGIVEIYPLVRTGLPDNTLLQLVATVCSGNRVRPLTDCVKVLAPVVVDYTIDAELILLKDADFSKTKTLAHQAIDAYIAECSAKLGQDIVPSQIIACLQVDGVYQVRLKTPDLISLKEQEWARCIDARGNINKHIQFTILNDGRII